jgi:conjugal transfer pilus assembly protein TraK
MVKFVLSFVLISITGLSSALTTQSFRDNSDVNVVLSDSNYNRLVVRGDKITQAHFPEGLLGVKNEEDGSLYVMLASEKPFTLFLTTESGHHFSATVTSEQALGKTIEFIPQTPATVRPIVQKSIVQQEAPYATAIGALMTNMINNNKPVGFELKNHYGRVIRLQQSLMLTPKRTYQGLELNGEVLELYNGGKLPLDLQEAWFADNNVKAVSLSAVTLAPKQKALVYRVLERAHG